MASTQKPLESGRSWRRGESNSLMRLIVGGAAWSLAGRFGKTAIMLIGTMALARMLTPADFGLMAVVAVFLLLVFVLLEGFVEYPLLRVTEITENNLRSLIWSGCVLAAIVSAAVFAAADLLAELFGMNELGDAFRAISPVFVVQVIAVAGRALLRREHRFRDVSRVLVASTAAYVCVAIALAALGCGYWSLVVGQIVSYVAMATFYGRAVRLPLRPPGQFDLGGLTSTIVYGSLSRGSSWFWSQIDTLAVGVASTAAATGIYSRAYNLSTHAKELFVSFDIPARHALVLVRERGEPIDEVAVVMLRLLTLATASTAALLIALREPIILILLGDQWLGAEIPFAILVAALPARMARQFLDSVSLSSGRMEHMLIRDVFLSLLIGFGGVIAAPHGIVPVAAVVTASLYIALVNPIEFILHRLELPRHLYLRSMAPGLLFGGLFFIVSEATLTWWPYGWVGYTTMIILVFAVLLGVVAMVLPDEWTFLSWQKKRQSVLRRLRVCM